MTYANFSPNKFTFSFRHPLDFALNLPLNGKKTALKQKIAFLTRRFFGRWSFVVGRSTGELELLGGVVGLDGTGLDDDGGVAALHVLALRGDGSCHVAGCQSQRYRQAGQQG